MLHRLSTLCFLLAVTVAFVLPTAAHAIGPEEVAAKQAYVVDYDTGAVLLDKAADQRMAPSSMTKVMTAYLVFDALEAGRLRLDQTLPVSEKAWRMQGSKMFVHVGDNVKVEDLIRGMIIQSGNDACIVLAEGLAGSEEAFAIAMNNKAKELGMTGSNFMNASGWPDPNHYSTAHDLAILARGLIEHFPQYYKYDSEKEFTYNNIKQGNRNPLLYRGHGADGMKTGHTEEGGYGLIGSGTINGRRVIMVLNGMDSMQQRADEGDRILSWALNGFDNLAPYANGQEIARARVALGDRPDVPLKLGKTLKVTVPKLAAGDVTLTATYREPLVAPVKVGEEVGQLTITLKGGAPMVVPIVVAQDVVPMGLIPRTFAKAMYALTGRGI